MRYRGLSAATLTGAAGVTLWVDPEMSKDLLRIPQEMPSGYLLAAGVCLVVRSVELYGRAKERDR